MESLLAGLPSMCYQGQSNPCSRLSRAQIHYETRSALNSKPETLNPKFTSRRGPPKIFGCRLWSAEPTGCGALNTHTHTHTHTHTNTHSMFGSRMWSAETQNINIECLFGSRMWSAEPQNINIECVCVCVCLLRRSTQTPQTLNVAGVDG